MDIEYKEDYFYEYKDYYDELTVSGNIHNMANKYNEQISDAINTYTVFKYFVGSSNLQGESKKAIDETVSLLDGQYETLKYNIENSLIPTSENLELLKENLTNLKRLNTQYKFLLEKFEKLNSNIPSEYITKTNEKGEVIFIENSEYQLWKIKVATIKEEIENHEKEIKKVKNLCEDCIKQIKILEKLIKTFSSFQFSKQQNICYENNTSSFYWKVNDVVYQLITPICKIDGEYKNITLDEQYIMVYDLKTIAKSLNVLNEDGNIDETAPNYKYYQKLEDCLDDRINGKDSYMYEYKANVQPPKEIGNILNQVLQCTYDENIDVPRSVVSTIFATNNPIVKLRYQGIGQIAYTNGFDENYKFGSFDCIGLIRWSQYQEILGDNQTGYHEMGIEGNSFDPYSILHDYSIKGDDFSNLSQNDWKNVSIGSVLVDHEGGSNYHVGRIIGHTTVDGEPAIVVSDSRKSTGLTNSVYKMSELYDSRWDGLSPYHVLADAAINGSKAGHRNILQIQNSLGLNNDESGNVLGKSN